MKTTILAVLTLFLLDIERGHCEPHFTNEAEDYMGFQSKFSVLSSTFDGGQNPTYEWYHNGTTLASGTTFVTGSTVRFYGNTLGTQGIYQLFVSSNLGRIFGREIKVEFMVVGKFLDKTKRTLNVVIGRPFEIECPAHEFTQNAGYKWGGTSDITGTWFLSEKRNMLGLDDGRLFFSHVTTEDVEFIARMGGIGCLLEATHEEDIRLEQSGVFELNVTGDETKFFGPHLQKIPDHEVVEGSSVWLKCIAAGYPTPTYEWKRTDRLGITSTVIATEGVTFRDHNKGLIIKNIIKERHAGTYTCYATVDHNGVKNTTQENTRVIIREKPAWFEGTQIKSATPDIYSQHTWMCMAKGDPEPEYNWYANATIMNNVSGRHTIEGGILTFHRVTPEDNGMYQCTAKNKFGFAYQTVSLKVKVKGPEITQALTQNNFVAGNSGKISCVSDALPPASHHWMFNGLKLEPNKTDKYELTANQDLIVHDLKQADTGTYRCLATNTYGRAEKDGYFKVAEIMFKRRPENKTKVIQGTVFSLFCEADSDPPLSISYRWLFDGKELSGINHNWDVNTHTLTVSNAQARASGIYSCIAYSPTSQKSSNATVIVRALPEPPTNLTLHGACTDRTAKLTWVIRYRSVYEPLTRILIQWTTSGDTSTWYNFTDHAPGSANGHVVKELNPYSDIVFRVIAVNAVGMGKASNTSAGQECKTPAAPPTICAANVQGNSTRPHEINVTWQDVEPVNHNGPGFRYNVRYRPQGSIVWYSRTISYGNKPQFTIQNTSANQIWDVEVKSHNDEGTGPSCPVAKARSGNEAEIMFKIRPGNKTDVSKGSSFSLRCEAYSNPPLPINYKWLHKGQELSQTGKTYTVSVSKIKDSGIYECVAYVKSSIYNAERRSAAIVIVQGPPDAPRNLALSGTCSNASANLTWTIDRDAYQPLTQISIQWSTSEDTSTWYDVTDNVAGSAKGHVVHGLNPYSNVVFRVIAVNKHGRSEPSDSTSGQECKTPQARPTVCPTDVKGTAKVHTIVISWKAVPRLYQNGPDFAYNVSFRKPGSVWQHEVVNGAERYTISNAGVDQLWEFRVQSMNAQGNGPECSIQQARTAREAPQLAPQSLKYKEIGADYVMLEWTVVDVSGIEGYQLSYWHKGATKTRARRAKLSTCNDENKPCTSRIESPSKRNYTQERLKPYKEYTMFLQAYNLAGLGPKSDPLTLTTKEDKPGPAEHVKITPYGRYFNMSWKPPSEPNGVISGYVLRITNGTNITVSGSTRVYLFKDLQPLREYVVYINAKTSAGLGNTVSKMESTTTVRPPAVPSPPTVRALGSDTVNVTYNPSTKPGGFPEKFYIVYKEKGQDDNEGIETNVTLIKYNGEKSYIVIPGLKSDQHYLFATVVMNENMKSKRSDYTEVHLLGGEEVSEEHTPIYRRFWFYIILGIILLLLLLLLLLLFIRRKPKRTYKVGEREKKRAVDDSIEMGEEHPLKDAEVKEEEPQGKTYDPVAPAKTDDPVLATSPPRSNGTASRDSLDEYEGSDDDFSETGSFIGQYGDGKKPEASQPSFV